MASIFVRHTIQAKNVSKVCYSGFSLYSITFVIHPQWILHANHKYHKTNEKKEEIFHANVSNLEGINFEIEKQEYQKFKCNLISRATLKTDLDHKRKSNTAPRWKTQN